jgi:hypothetical protein
MDLKQRNQFLRLLRENCPTERLQYFSSSIPVAQKDNCEILDKGFLCGFFDAIRVMINLNTVFNDEQMKDAIDLYFEEAKRLIEGSALDLVNGECHND